MYAGFKAIGNVTESENPFFDPCQQQPSHPRDGARIWNFKRFAQPQRGDRFVKQIYAIRFYHHMTTIGGRN